MGKELIYNYSVGQFIFLHIIYIYSSSFVTILHTWTSNFLVGHDHVGLGHNSFGCVGHDKFSNIWHITTSTLNVS